MRYSTENINIHISPTYIHVTRKYMPLHIYIYSNIYTKNKAERVFMMRPFLSQTENKSFRDMVISLVQ